MKSAKTILATLVSTTLLAGVNVAQASESDTSCAVISTKKVPLNRSKRELVLTSHNGKELTDKTNRAYLPSTRRSARIESSLQGPSQVSLPNGIALSYRTYENMVLTPGIHHFTGYAAQKNVSRNINSSAARQSRGNESFSFTINVEAGKRYNLIAERTSANNADKIKRFHPVILSSKNSDCNQLQASKVYPSVALQQLEMGDSEQSLVLEQLTAQYTVAN